MSLILAKIADSKLGPPQPALDVREVHYTTFFSEATQLESKLELEECFGQQVEAERNQVWPLVYWRYTGFQGLTLPFHLSPCLAHFALPQATRGCVLAMATPAPSKGIWARPKLVLAPQEDVAGEASDFSRLLPNLTK